MDVKLMTVSMGGVEIKVPETWSAETNLYIEPDGRECSMIEVSATEGDPRSIIISYGPMPEGSDALMEAGGTYEELIGEFGPEPEDDPICRRDRFPRSPHQLLLLQIFSLPERWQIQSNWIFLRQIAEKVHSRSD